MAKSFQSDILPLFTAQDVNCMRPRHIRLNDANWMCDPGANFDFADHANARHVYERLADGSMPPGGAWSPQDLATYAQWMADGFHA